MQAQSIQLMLVQLFVGVVVVVAAGFFLSNHDSFDQFSVLCLLLCFNWKGNKKVVLPCIQMRSDRRHLNEKKQIEFYLWDCICSCMCVCEDSLAFHLSTYIINDPNQSINELEI